ncbi:MAG: chemotaxis protein CheY [Phycisphaerales bacterium]|nr:chemotaxis protein CheY [Phycisphaerales bacterium]
MSDPLAATPFASAGSGPGGAPSAAAEAGAVAVTGQTILVADDETHILNVVSLKLRNAGYRVLTAADGQQALDLARLHRPDLLVTDYHMPLLSGLELCRRLRQDPATAGLRVVMLTARGYHLDEQEMRASGISRMMSKPFSPRHLLLTVSEVIAAAKAA